MHLCKTQGLLSARIQNPIKESHRPFEEGTGAMLTSGQTGYFPHDPMFQPVEGSQIYIFITQDVEFKYFTLNVTTWTRINQQHYHSSIHVGFQLRIKKWCRIQLLFNFRPVPDTSKRNAAKQEGNPCSLLFWQKPESFKCRKLNSGELPYAYSW